MTRTHIVQQLKSEKGMATIETIPLIFIFLFLITYMFGFFGVIHTGIMHSISARSYAFEIFRNRTNLTYFSDVRSDPKVFTKMGNRVHGIVNENNPNTGNGMHAAARPIRIGMSQAETVGSENDHNSRIYDQTLVGQSKRNTVVAVNPVWIMVEYGICLDATCGGGN